MQTKERIFLTFLYTHPQKGVSYALEARNAFLALLLHPNIPRLEIGLRVCGVTNRATGGSLAGVGRWVLWKERQAPPRPTPPPSGA